MTWNSDRPETLIKEHPLTAPQSCLPTVVSPLIGFTGTFKGLPFEDSEQVYICVSSHQGVLWLPRSRNSTHGFIALIEEDQRRLIGEVDGNPSFGTG